MRQAFVHEAVLDMRPDADTRAPGGKITVELCGHWEHEPPCPLAPHHTSAERRDGQVHLRTLFATDPDQEHTVRDRIDAALAAGLLHGPDGTTTVWHLRASHPGDLAAHERDHAARLIRT